MRSWGFFLHGIGPSTPSACVGPPGRTGEWWMNPKPLKAIQPSNTPSLLILPMPYKIDDKTYNTVRFQTTTANGSVGWNYDLATGILVHSHTAATTAEKAHAWAGETITFGQYAFLGLRQLQTPLGQRGTAGLAGHRQAFPVRRHLHGDRPGRRAAACSAGPRRTSWPAARPGCCVPWRREMFGPPGGPPNTGKALAASGLAQIGGVWLPPSAIPGLTVGLLIDKDPFTGAETRVTLNGALPNGTQGVVLREESSGQVTEWTYDAASGVLQAMRIESRILPTVTLLHLTQVN